MELLTLSIEEQQLKWFGDLKRMEEEKPMKAVREARPMTKKTKGKPKTT